MEPPRRPTLSDSLYSLQEKLFSLTWTSLISCPLPVSGAKSMTVSRLARPVSVMLYAFTQHALPECQRYTTNTGFTTVKRRKKSGSSRGLEGSWGNSMKHITEHILQGDAQSRDLILKKLSKKAPLEMQHITKTWRLRRDQPLNDLEGKISEQNRPYKSPATKTHLFISNSPRGTYGAQSVKPLTLTPDVGSGHHLRVLRSGPTLGSALGKESACPREESASPSPSVSAPPFTHELPILSSISQ